MEPGWKDPARVVKRRASSFSHLEHGASHQIKVMRDEEARYSKLAARHAPDVLPSRLGAQKPSAGLFGHPGMPLVPSAPARFDAMCRLSISPPEESSSTRPRQLPMRVSLSPGGSSGGSGYGLVGAPVAATICRRRRRAPPLGPCFMELPAREEATLWQYRLAYRKFRLGFSHGAGDSPHRLARHNNTWRLRNSDFHRNIERAEGFVRSGGSPGELDTALGTDLNDIMRGFHSAGALQTAFAVELAQALAEIEALETVPEHEENGQEPDGEAGHFSDATLHPALLPFSKAAPKQPAPSPSAATRAGVAPLSTRAQLPPAQPPTPTRRASLGPKGFKHVHELTRHFKMGRELGKGHFSTVRLARLREKPLTDEQLAALDRQADVEKSRSNLSTDQRVREQTWELIPAFRAFEVRSSSKGAAKVEETSEAFGQRQAVIARRHACYPSEVAIKIVQKPNTEKQMDLLRKVDTFALGVICYIVLSGTEPFTGDNDMETAQRTKTGDFSFDGDEWDKVSAMAKGFIERCLQADPEKRPTAKEILGHAWLNVNVSTSNQ
ncbi:hypothetical protein T492DRAFT_943070 [Pavlovales sp. CCMP2436]|nr:hypothetical protein T492DRAFT_943070 [Pavlovales sp. CCMP2436]